MTYVMCYKKGYPTKADTVYIPTVQGTTVSIADRF